MISYKDFEKIDIRAGTIIDVTDFPEARKAAYKLRIDFGPDIGIKQSSAQITKHYAKNDLIGKQIVAVVNFPEKQIASFFSQVLVLGLPDENGDVVLVNPGIAVANGVRLF